MKKILKAVLALVVILLALILAHPLWIGPVVRTAVSQLAPKFLGVPAKLDGFSLNLYSGRVAMDGFTLENPPGCAEPNFVSVGHFCVDVNPMSVLSDPIVVEEISVRDLYVSIVTDAEKVYNYKTITATCSSGEGQAPKTDPKPAMPKPTDEKPAPKVIIDLVQVQNALVQWERVRLPLPSFRMTGIGRATSGVEFEAAWTEVEKQFLASLGPLAAGLRAMLTGTQGAVDTGLKSVSEVSKSVGDTKKALNDVGKALKDGSSASAEAARDSVDAAAKSIKGSVDTLKSLFK